MEWLQRYRAHNDELSKRLMHRNRKGSSLEAPRSIREICDECEAPPLMTCEGWMLKRREPENAKHTNRVLADEALAARARHHANIGIGEKSGAYVPAQLREFVRRGADAQRAVDAIVQKDEMSNAQAAKLFAHRLHRIAAVISGEVDRLPHDPAFRGQLVRELNELADDIEEHMATAHPIHDSDAIEAGSRALSRPK